MNFTFSVFPPTPLPSPPPPPLIVALKYFHNLCKGRLQKKPKTWDIRLLYLKAKMQCIEDVDYYSLN